MHPLTGGITTPEKYYSVENYNENRIFGQVDSLREM
jgi:hypothetical protein